MRGGAVAARAIQAQLVADGTKASGGEFFKVAAAFAFEFKDGFAIGADKVVVVAFASDLEEWGESGDVDALGFAGLYKKLECAVDGCEAHAFGILAREGEDLLGRDRRVCEAEGFGDGVALARVAGAESSFGSGFRFGFRFGFGFGLCVGFGFWITRFARSRRGGMLRVQRLVMIVVNMSAMVVHGWAWGLGL